ncbi:mannosyltransferase [Bizionia sediminis]|uniref:Mannosyltransferase n=1 Tax=Bizionia sediminis TaxID=1737064 RepID=A0ABW5KR33_9FLAO
MKIGVFIQAYKFQLLLVLSSMLFYGTFAYNLDRTDGVKLVLLYAALYGLFYKIIKLTKHQRGLLIGLAFIFRAIFIVAIPNLSQDFYRFIWDGRLVLAGFNPYLFTPNFFVLQNQFPIEQAQTLFNGMGALSAGNYSNYPPINQFCFAIAGIFAHKSILGSVVILRLLIIAADFGILYYGNKLLQHFKLPKYLIFWYLLNPFIIIELTGNLHFEGVMLFFLIWSLYLLIQKKWISAAVIFACSVSVKLIPLLFLPLFFNWFQTKTPTNNRQLPLFKSVNFAQLVWFYALVGLVTIGLFLPFYTPEFVVNYSKTVALWFQKFEFNASFYYLFRAIGYWLTGYNTIAVIGSFTALFVSIFVFTYGIITKPKNGRQLIQMMLVVLSVYYFTATTVHPWYLAPLVLFSVYTPFKFPLVWSFVVIFSYLAYSNTAHTENLWLIAFQYFVVFAALGSDIFKIRRTAKQPNTSTKTSI